MGHEEMMHKIAQIRHLDLKDELKSSNIGITGLELIAPDAICSFFNNSLDDTSNIMDCCLWRT